MKFVKVKKKADKKARIATNVSQLLLGQKKKKKFVATTADLTLQDQL